MCLREQRPFLRERHLPFVVFVAARCEDVLEDARLLIECFFDEKRVVEDLKRLRPAPLAASRHRQNQHHRRGDLHEHLGGRACADGDALVVLGPDAHAVRHRVTLFDLDGLAGLQVMVLDETQEASVLIDDTRDRDLLVERAGEQRLGWLRLDHSRGVWNRVAVRIHLRSPEHFVHPVDQPLGHGVLELFRLVVNLVPAVAHDTHEEQLDHPVPPNHERGKLLSRSGKGHPRVGLVFDETRLRQGLDHRRSRPWRDSQRAGELAHGEQSVRRGQCADPEVDRLQIVLDRAGRKHFGC